jgi:transposase
VLRPEPVPEVPAETARLAWRVHPKGTEELRVRDALGALFADEDFLAGELAGTYPPTGQPALSPALLAAVTVLQFAHNLSDREAATAAADRISWKYLLGLELDAPGFDPSVLCEFRARLVAAPGRADRLLGVLLERLRAAGLVRAGGRQRTDATHVLAAVRRLNRIEQVGETLRSALEAVARVDPDWLTPLLGPGWDARYGRKVETSRLLKRDHSHAAAMALARQVGADGQQLLDRLGADPAAGRLRELAEVRVLRTVWSGHYQQAGSGLRWRPPAELPAAPERVESPYDPAAHYARKPQTTWVGFKAHLTETCDDDLPHLVTDAHTTPATDPDVVATTAIQSKLIARGLAPGEHLLDGGYPSAANLAAARALGITMVSPLAVASGRRPDPGTFGPDAFAVDWPANHATCPAGARSLPGRRGKRGMVTFPFSNHDCRGCPLRRQCTGAQADRPRRLSVHPQPAWQAQRDARTAQATPGWWASYAKRAGIEATISQAVRGSGLRRARYRGLAKAHLQHVLVGIAIDVLRLGDWFDPAPTTPRRATRVHQLCLDHGLAA